jgi:hypothetical protein
MDCVICGNVIHKNSSKYCSKVCAKEATHESYKELNPGSVDRSKRYSSSTGAARIHRLLRTG